MHHGLRQLALATVATLALPGAASAVELQPSIAGTVNWTDNLFSSPNVEDDDTFFAATPGLAISDEGGRLRWSLSYEPSYLLYTNFNDLNGWDHDVDASVSFSITPRTRVYASNRYRKLSSVSRFNETSDVAGFPTGITALPGRNQFQRNVAIAGFEHALGKRTFLYGSYFNSLLVFERDDQPDRFNQEARLSIDYALRKDLRAGVRVGWSQSEIEPDEAPNRKGNFYNVSLTTTWTPTPDTTILASGGPTLVDNDSVNASFSNPEVPQYPVQIRSGGIFYTRITTCPQLADGTFYLTLECQASPFNAIANQLVSIPQQGTTSNADNREITFFANLRLIQRWDHWRLDVGYNRQDDQSVSSGVSGVVNVGSVRLEYEPAPRWKLILAGAYILRESTTDTVVNALALTPATGSVPIFGNLTGLEIAESSARRLISGDAKSKTKTWRTFFKTIYYLNERLELNGTVLYTTQQDDFNGSQVREYDRFTGWLGITYRFAPIHF